MKCGKRSWVIPDGYIPQKSTGDLESHESLCVLNTNEEEAQVTITIYFEEQEPLEGFSVTCLGRRTKHIRMNELKSSTGEGIPKGIPYALYITSDHPIVVQYSRLDSSQEALALMTTMGY